MARNNVEKTEIEIFNKWWERKYCPVTGQSCVHQCICFASARLVTSSNEEYICTPQCMHELMKRVDNTFIIAVGKVEETLRGR